MVSSSSYKPFPVNGGRLEHFLAGRRQKGSSLAIMLLQRGVAYGSDSYPRAAFPFRLGCIARRNNSGLQICFFPNVARGAARVRLVYSGSWIGPGPVRNARCVSETMFNVEVHDSP